MERATHTHTHSPSAARPFFPLTCLSLSCSGLRNWPLPAERRRNCVSSQPASQAQRVTSLHNFQKTPLLLLLFA